MNSRQLFRSSIALLASVAVASTLTTAQIATGGTYALEQSVIANGGGNSTAGNYAVESTAGQSAAGTNGSGGMYSLRGGFWNTLPGPRGGNVTISGRVLRNDGIGIRNGRVSISGKSLTSRRAAWA